MKQKKLKFNFSFILCNLEKQQISKELENIVNIMNDYYNSLSAIENVIKNWDPLEKVNF
jgi:hypothetical protein